MDALPVTDETGLSYASVVKSKNAARQEVGVMHGCGHDIRDGGRVHRAIADRCKQAGKSARSDCSYGWQHSWGHQAQRDCGGQALPGPHTSKFEPVPEATLRTGVTAMSSAAIALLQ